jgi:HEAT repeats/Putative zinc-finger
MTEVGGSHDMREPKDCTAVRDQFALLLYGELSFDEEERVESHLDSCAECRRALAHQRVLHEAVDSLAVTPSPALLSRSREDLSAQLDRERAARMGTWWHQLTAGWKIQFLRPAGAVALLAMGFLAAKATPGWNIFGVNPEGAYQGSYQGMSLGSFGGAQVRNVSADRDGRVRIVLNETRQRMVSGNLGDQQIRVLLLAAAKEAADPGLRAQSVTILTGEADAGDVREALMSALADDQDADVRLKAMEGLRRFAGDPFVQDALARVLLSDSNSGIRTHAIDVLTSRPGPNLDRQTVGALQEMMDREKDAYVRAQGQRMLRSIKASSGTY